MDKMENRHTHEMIEMKNQHKLLNDKLDNLERVVSQQKSCKYSPKPQALP